MRTVVILGLLLCSACIVQQPPYPRAASAPPPGPQAGLPPVASAQQTCREFDTPVIIAGRQEQAHGTACLQPDGSWSVQQSVADQPPQTYVVPPQQYQAYYPPDYVADPWYYGPPLFVGGFFVGGGWGFHHHHGGWHGHWNGGPWIHRH